MGQFNLIITDQDHNKTIQTLLTELNVGRKKQYLYDISKAIYINNVVANLKNILKKDDILSINWSVEKKVEPWFVPIDILYEDDYLIIVNKPRGLLVHPDGISNKTIFNQLIAKFIKDGHDAYPFVIHRIDIETTGCLLFAKDPITESILNKMMSEKQIKRIYLTRCEGVFDKKQGVIDLPLGTDRHCNGKMVVNHHGLKAITKYQVIDEQMVKNKLCTNLKVALDTGRTHQIRVHLSYLHHPLVGDKLYGSKIDVPMFLHSLNISFIHPYTQIKINQTSLVEK